MKRILPLGGLVFVYILSFPVQMADAAEVKQTYTKECAKCHGDQGKGDGTALVKVKGKAADWTDKAAMAKLSDEHLIKITLEGGGAVGKSKLMPAYGKKLDEKTVKEMVSFIRSLAK